MGVVLLTAAFTFLLSGCASGQPEPSQASPPELPAATEEIFTPVVGAVLAEPYAVPSTDGNTHLAYELVLTNVMGQSLTLDGVSVAGDGKPLLSLDGEDLTPWVRPLGAAAPSRILAPGQQALVTMDVVVASPEESPQVLTHTLELTPEQAMPPMVGEKITQQVAPSIVRPEAPVVIGSPVRGDAWLDGNSCCEVTPHRSAINPINGSLFAPERFAIDFVQVDSSGKIFDGPIDDFASYEYFGADLFAVADGPIVSMRWDLPDEQPGAHPVGLELAEYGGNHIVQDIGGGNYAFYAHLQGDNAEGLEVGQELKRGDMIAKLGNSGNTDMPHLHFHVMDSPLPLASNGLPFLLDQFELAGTVTDDDLMACMEDSISCNVDTSGSAEMQSKGLLYRDVMDVAQ